MRDELEQTVKRAAEAGDFAAATTLVIEHQGPEILAFLGSRMRSDCDAEEVFACFVEKLWLGMPAFEWRCTMRSWAYRLARNCANDHARSARRQRARIQLGAVEASMSAVVDLARTTTAAHRRTSVKDRVRELRESLPEDDQMLLILRVDRGLDFRELAVALAAENAPVDGVDIERDAARLRKRFERVKERLRVLARDAGLLE